MSLPTKNRHFFYKKSDYAQNEIMGDSARSLEDTVKIWRIDFNYWSGDESPKPFQKNGVRGDIITPNGDFYGERKNWQNPVEVKISPLWRLGLPSMTGRRVGSGSTEIRGAHSSS